MQHGGAGGFEAANSFFFWYCRKRLKFALIFLSSGFFTSIQRAQRKLSRHSFYSSLCSVIVARGIILNSHKAVENT